MMRLLNWLMRKGLAGAVARDLLNKYIAIQHQHPNEEVPETAKRVWQSWLKLNEGPILEEHNRDKIIRLDLMKQDADMPRDLMELYGKVLYIETELSPEDGKLYLSVLRIFVHEAHKFGMDFSREYQIIGGMLRT